MKRIIIIAKNIQINQIINNITGYEIKSFFTLYSAYNHLILDGNPFLILLEYNDENFYQNYQVLQSILSNNTPIIAIFKEIDYPCIEFALKYGINDYFILNKDTTVDLKLKITKLKYNDKTNQTFINPIKFIDNSLKVKINDKEVEFTKNEYAILKLLFTVQGKVISRENIIDKLWNNKIEFNERTIDTHIKSIRKKLNNLEDNIISINTKYTQGYYLTIKK